MIDNGTESSVLVLLRDGLDNRVRIAIGIQIKESGQVDSEGAVGGIALGSELFIGEEPGAAQEGERRAIGGEEAVIGVCGSGFERLIEAIEGIAEYTRIQFGSFSEREQVWRDDPCHKRRPRSIRCGYSGSPVQ